MEANAKGYWDTDEENLEKLRDVYQEPFFFVRNVTYVEVCRASRK